MADARQETLDNLSWIRTSEKAEHAINEKFIPVDPCPTPAPKGIEPVSFFVCGTVMEERGDFMQLPRTVRCQYSVTLTGDQSSYSTADFEAKAVCDLDEDGEMAVYIATKGEKPKAKTPPDVY